MSPAMAIECIAARGAQVRLPCKSALKSCSALQAGHQSLPSISLKTEDAVVTSGVVPHANIEGLLKVFQAARLPAEIVNEIAEWCQCHGISKLQQVVCLTNTLCTELDLKLLERRRLEKTLAAALCKEGSDNGETILRSKSNITKKVRFA